MASPALLTTAVAWFRGFWTFYHRYTDTTVHTATMAALAIFGVLVFVDPWFAAVAIACYVVPPVVLYALADEPGLEDEHRADDADRIGKSVAPPSPRDRAGLESTTATRDGPGAGGAGVPDGDTDSDADGGDADADTDGDDGDSDSDSDNGDTDSDSDDGDTDSDSDDGDSDSDSDDGDSDSDSDSDNGDTDSDSDDGDTDSDSDG